MIGLQLLNLVTKKAPIHVQKVQDCLVHNMADLARYVQVLLIHVCMK